MLEFEVLLLPEWYARQKKRGHSAVEVPFMRLFGSFLNADSLDLAWHLTSPDILEVFDMLSPQYLAGCNANPLIQLIFFPISRSFSQNIQVKNAFVDILENIPRKSGFLPDFCDIIAYASREIEKSQQEFVQLYFNENISAEDSPEFEFRVNKFFFGPLTAHYLQKIRMFPQVEVKNLTYHGIPQNLTLDDFLEKILLVELYSILVKA